jgi:2-C-methyl-D-erythritol 4-phosphate cytidylyltransferase
MPGTATPPRKTMTSSSSTPPLPSGSGQPSNFALIPAAGVGARMAANTPKQYLPIGGKPMLRHTVEAFLGSSLVSHTFVVVSPADGLVGDVLPVSMAGVTVLRCGGASRMETVLNALRQLGSDGLVDAADRVLVHDAARPGLTPALIARLIDGAGAHPAGGLLALPVVDTVKRASVGPAGAGAEAGTTVPRDGLWLAQTPQMFPYQLLLRALAAAAASPEVAATITDDASAIEALGLSPLLVEGHPRNLKVTLPQDIRIAEMYLAAGEQ